jgi:uncharacterized membrane protein
VKDSRRAADVAMDDSFDAAIGRILQIGVFVSAAAICFGATIYLWKHGSAVSSYRVFTGEPHELTSVIGIVADAKRFSGRGIIQCGLLLLIATPIARVVFSVVAFGRQRDRLYVAITSIVLLLLLFSLISG